MQQVYERFEDNTRTLLPNPPGEWGALTPSLPACWTAWPTKRTYHTLCLSVNTWGKLGVGSYIPFVHFGFRIVIDLFISSTITIVHPLFHYYNRKPMRESIH